MRTHAPSAGGTTAAAAAAPVATAGVQLMRQAAALADWLPQAAPDTVARAGGRHHAALPGPPGMPQGHPRQRADLLRQVQRMQGNRAVQRLLASAQPAHPRAGALSTAPVQAAPLLAERPARAPAAATSPQPAPVQRDEQDGAPWWKLASFGESLAWRMMGQFAPQLVPIVRKGPAGVVDWLQDRAGRAAGAVFDSLMGPVRAITGAGSQLSAQFTPWVAGLQDAAAKIASNDCGPITQAADRIAQTAQRIVTPILDTLQPVVAKVQAFLGAAWDKVGAPIWQWIQDYAGQQWDLVKQLAGWIWSFSEPMRSLGAEAWTWIKSQIGIGEGPEGEHGILQWLQGKLEAAWAQVKLALEPFGKQIGIVRGALGELAQAVTGPIGQVSTLAAQAGKGISWLGANLGRGNALVRARSQVEKSVIPPLVDGLHRMGAAVSGLADGVAAALGKVAAGLSVAAGALAHPLLQLAASALRWIAGEAQALAVWAGQKLAGVAQWLGTAVGRFETFLHGLAEFLHKVGAVAANVWGLPALLAGKVWNWIPACIRDPVVDFIVPIILRQIELFEELGRDATAWQKTKAQIMGIVRRVFVDHDLIGAVKAAFALVLRVFNIPEDLLGKIAAKAAAAWDVVVQKPIDFIKNTVRSLGHGFKLLWTNIGTHLGNGIEGWLLGELDGKNIRPPAKWTDPKALFGFVVDVLGLNVAHLVELLKKRIDPGLVDKAQAWVGRFARAWDWISEVINTSKTPAQNGQGLIDRGKDFGRTVLTGVVEWVTGKVAAELATLSAAAAASGGLSEVVDVARRVYKAMVTAKRWAGRILQMASDTLDHVLDIAAGNVSKVGAEFEKLMDRGMPVVIGFLADQVGLGGVGAAVRDIVDRLRAQVDAAILWLIDKAKAGIKAVLGAGTAAAGADPSTEQPDQSVVRTLTMRGENHTLTLTLHQGTLHGRIASIDPGDLIEKLTAKAQSLPKRSKTAQAEKSALESIVHYYEADKRALDALPDRQSQGELKRQMAEQLAQELVRMIVSYAEQFGRHDFARELFGVDERLDSIKKQIDEQIEKHLMNDKAVGNRRATGAAAAEVALGWQGPRGERHVDKVRIAWTVIVSALGELQSLENAGLDLSQDSTYQRGKNVAAECEDALSRPHSHLINNGLVEPFVRDMRKRNLLIHTSNDALRRLAQGIV